MNPKLKAISLVDEYHQILRLIEKTDSYEKAKRCALKCVDEILNTSMQGYLVNTTQAAEFQIKMRDYWLKVKQEIEIL